MATYFEKTDVRTDLFVLNMEQQGKSYTYIQQIMHFVMPEIEASTHACVRNRRKFPIYIQLH